MNRSSTNFLVDAVAFAAIMLLVTTGALIRYILPPGSGHFSQLWGMDRHQWGQIHFWIAVVLLIAVVVHLFLHWHWIVGMVRGCPDRGLAIRVNFAIISVLVLTGLMVAPFLGEVQETEEPPHKLQSDEHRANQINGSMTLHEIEEQTGVPATVILKELGLPADLPTDERLGRLRRQHGFEMHDVQEIVRKHRERP